MRKIKTLTGIAIIIAILGFAISACDDPAPVVPTAVATPTATPAAGTYTSAQSISLATATEGADIYYTIDNSAPTKSSTLYSASISISQTTTLKAIAVKSGMNDSGILTALYTIELPLNTVVAPAATPPAGTYYNPVNVSLATTTEGAGIYYTLDGTDPDETSASYTAGSSITISQTTTLKAIATKEGMTDSSILEALYTVNVAPPTATPPAGTYTIPRDVSLATETEDASIYYTLDGTAPDETKTLYTGGFITIGQTTTLKAIAIKTGMTSSTILEALYTINLAPTSQDSIVSIVRSSKANVTDLDQTDIDALVRQAVALAGGLDDLIDDGMTVALKPNIVVARDNCGPNWTGTPLVPEANGIITDYRVVRAVAKIVRELNPNGRIIVIEGSEQNTTANYAALKYTKTDIPEVDDFIAIESDSGSWRGMTPATDPNLETGRPGLKKVEFQNNEGLYRQFYYFNRQFYEADVLICLPVLKNHWDAAVTGSIKNISIGATPANIYGNSQFDGNRNSMIDHGVPNFHRWIADYYTLRPADFTIMDGLQASEFGPSATYAIYGSESDHISKAQLNMRTIVASKDSLANDIVLSNIVNFDPATVPYLQYLTEAGKVGNGNPSNIVVLGAKVDDLRNHVLNFTRANTTYSGEFRGREPIAGGKKIQAADKVPPTITITSASFNGDNLVLALNVSTNTDKLDIYIDNEYKGSVKYGFANVTFPTTGLASGPRNITVYAYNRNMYHAAATQAVTK